MLSTKLTNILKDVKQLKKSFIFRDEGSNKQHKLYYLSNITIKNK